MDRSSCIAGRTRSQTDAYFKGVPKSISESGKTTYVYLDDSDSSGPICLGEYEGDGGDFLSGDVSSCRESLPAVDLGRDTEVRDSPEKVVLNCPTEVVDTKRAEAPASSNAPGVVRKAMEDNNDDISVDDISPSKKTRARSPSPSSQPRTNINSESNPSTIRSNVVKSDEIPEADSTVKRRKGTLLNEERHIALQRASSFSSKNPFFVVVMEPSYVNGKTLTVPTEFCREHLSNSSGDAILSKCNGNYSSFVFTLNPNPTFHGGWDKFVKENHLDVGHVCVFELIDQTKITFNVEVFRHAQDAETGPKPAIEGSKCALPSAPQGFTSFKSENPFFLKTIKQSNFPFYKLILPGSFMKEHIKKDAVNLTVDDGGKLWPVKVLSYEKKMRRDAYLGGGWREFASENSVKVGDVCAFELIKKEDGVLKVHISSEPAK